MSLRLPDGNLSPAAFSPIPRLGPQGPSSAARSLPPTEAPCLFASLWEQQLAEGMRKNPNVSQGGQSALFRYECFLIFAFIYLLS